VEERKNPWALLNNETYVASWQHKKEALRIGKAKKMMFLTLSASSKVIPRYFRHGVPVFSVNRGYHENIVEHYENPRNVGAMNKNDEDVGTVRN
jgi:hypothetical protein